MQKFHTELFDRYVAALLESRWVALAGLVLVAAVMLVSLFRSDDRLMRITRNALLATTITGALLWAWQLRWLCDDAFISFRYAENLARGRGLVFNIGDRVEGYTNFLWTVMLACARLLGADIPQASVVLSLLSFALLIALTARVARTANPDRSHATLPLAAILCGGHYTLASFGTSGLETMLGAMLVMLALERAIAGRYFAAGLACVCAAMSHPDHGIFYVALGLALLMDSSRRRALLAYALPFVLLYVPYFIWRLRYYGDLFPNTYYAKSADQLYFSQGGVYLLAFFVGSGFLLAMPAILYGGWRMRSTLLGRFCFIAVPVFCLYVAKIGGDFMYGRLLCPLIAPLLVLGEAAVDRSLTDRRWIRAAAFAVVLTVVVLPTRILQPLEKRWHLSDERTFYPLASFAPIIVQSAYFDWGRALLAHFPERGQSPRLGIFCVGMIGYLTGLPLIDGYGLTDRFVAHSPIIGRGRPGHEKHGQPAYFLRRDVDITEDPIYPVQYQSFTRLILDKFTFHFVRYDPKVVAKLRKGPSARFHDYERTLRYELTKRKVTAENAHKTACDAWFADEFYFARSPQSPYRADVRKQLLTTGAPLIDGKLAPSATDFRETETHVINDANRIGFEPSDLSRLELSGTAFGAFPAYGEVLGQHMVGNQSGGVINTFDAVLKDVAVGRLQSKPFRLMGDVIELRVGGGPHSEQLRVSLVVEGKRLFSSGGCGTEVMGRRLWDISAYKNQLAVLEVVDETTGPWGHILVDEVVEWIPKP